MSIKIYSPYIKDFSKLIIICLIILIYVRNNPAFGQSSLTELYLRCYGRVKTTIKEYPNFLTDVNVDFNIRIDMQTNGVFIRKLDNIGSIDFSSYINNKYILFDGALSNHKYLVFDLDRFTGQLKMNVKYVSTSKDNVTKVYDAECRKLDEPKF